MEENFLITIDGTMEQNGEHDTVTLLTKGSFVKKNGNFYITYKETQATGFQGSTTTVKVSEDANRVSMLRFGNAQSQLIIEKGKRHICHYETGYGAISLGIAADEIAHNLTEQGGTLNFSYTLDTQNSSISTNFVKIEVKKQ